MPTASGERREMLYNKVSFVDQRGEVAGVIGTITEVTRYKEAERALEASEARFRVLTESSLDLISVLDAEGTILYQSPALRHLPQAPNVDVNVTQPETGVMWYRSPLWIAVGALAVVLLAVLIIMMTRGNETVIKQ